MNRAPRALNRAILAVLGVVAVAAGGLALTSAYVPNVRATWQRLGDGALTRATDLFAQTSHDGVRSWIWFLLLALVAIGLVLGTLVIAKQGGGRTSTLLKRAATEPESGEPSGSVLIDARVAEALLAEAITQDPAVLAVQVTAHRVQGETAMRVSLTLRRGASPTKISRRVEDTVANWDQMLGAQIPIVIEITGGIRARMRSEVRAT